MATTSYGNIKENLSVRCFLGALLPSKDGNLGNAYFQNPFLRWRSAKAPEQKPFYTEATVHLPVFKDYVVRQSVAAMEDLEAVGIRATIIKEAFHRKRDDLELLFIQAWKRP